MRLRNKNGKNIFKKLFPNCLKQDWCSVLKDPNSNTDQIKHIQMISEVAGKSEEQIMKASWLGWLILKLEEATSCQRLLFSLAGSSVVFLAELGH